MSGTTAPDADNDARDNADDTALRQRAARVLAGASTTELAECWADWPDRPEVEYLRGPEPGLVMVQGRMGGSGDRFNLGEATVVRATALVRGGGLNGELVGTSYVLGSDPEHAGLAAVFQALLGDPGQRERVLEQVIEPLQLKQSTNDASSRAQAHATTVNFFTVARENSGGVQEDDE